MKEGKKHKKWDEIIDHVSHFKRSFLSNSLNISRQYLFQVLNGKRPMPDKMLERINALLGTDFKKDTDPPLLPETFSSYLKKLPDGLNDKNIPIPAIRISGQSHLFQVSKYPK
jgi:hypothetical protein